MFYELETMQIDTVGGLTTGLSIEPDYGFSFGIRKEIFKRDKGTCQECGGNYYRDSLIMNAAHDNHELTRLDPEYDVAESGRLKCLPCHLKQHLGLFLVDFSPSARQSLRLITQYTFDNGYHLRTYNAQHPEQILLDREDLFKTFAEASEQTGFDINPWDFIRTA